MKKTFLPLGIMLLIILAFFGGLAFKSNRDGNSVSANPPAASLVNSAPKLTKNDMQTYAKDYTSNKENDYLVYFYSPECKGCVNFAQTTLKKYRTQPNALQVYDINVLDAKMGQTVNKYRINATPTMIRFVNHQETWRMIGSVPITEIPTKQAIKTK